MTTEIYDLSPLGNVVERFRHVKKGDLDAYFAAVDRLVDARTAVAEQIIGRVESHGCVMIQPTEGTLKHHRYYVHHSLWEEGKYQYTAWDNYGPIWHNDVSNASELEAELPSHPFTVTYK